MRNEEFLGGDNPFGSSKKAKKKGIKRRGKEIKNIIGTAP